MTQVTEPYGTNADRLDSARAPWRPVAVSLVLGLIIGALLAGLYGATRTASYQASTALSVQPDSLVNTQLSQNTPTVDSTAFIQSQLVVLNGSQLADQVQQQLKLGGRPSVNSTQVGQSYVVQVNATAGSRQQALSIAGATASLYAKQRSAQLSRDIIASIASIKEQLATTQQSLATAQAATPITEGLTPAETALQTEYERLLSVDSALNLALPQVNRVVTVLSPPSVAPAALSRSATYAAGGALIGALLGLATLIVGRRALPRIRSVADLAGLNVPVLLPVLPRRSRRTGHSADAWRSASGRLLAARLSGQQSGASDPIVVVGATPGVGASFVAATLAAGLIDRGPVLLVLAAEHSGEALLGPSGESPNLPPRTPQPLATLLDRARPSELPGLWLLSRTVEDPTSAGPVSVRAARLNELLDQAREAGWLTVVDAPPLTESDLAINCATSTGIAALVVGRGSTRPAEVISAAELFDAHGSRLAGLVLNDVPARLRLPGGADRQPRPAAQVAPEADRPAAAHKLQKDDPARPAPRSRAMRGAGNADDYSTEIVPFPPDSTR